MTYLSLSWAEVRSKRILISVWNRKHFLTNFCCRTRKDFSSILGMVGRPKKKRVRKRKELEVWGREIRKMGLGKMEREGEKKS